MATKEKRYKVRGRITIDYELIVQALNAEEARYFAGDIDLDKWREVDSDWEITEVARSFYLKMIKGQEQVSSTSVSSGE
jgi:choline kinase